MKVWCDVVLYSFNTVSGEALILKESSATVNQGITLESTCDGIEMQGTGQVGMLSGSWGSWTDLGSNGMLLSGGSFNCTHTITKTLPYSNEDLDYLWSITYAIKPVTVV